MSGRCDHHIDYLHRAADAAQFREQPPVFSRHVESERPQPEERKFAIKNQQIPLARLAEFNPAENLGDDR